MPLQPLAPPPCCPFCGVTAGGTAPIAGLLPPAWVPCGKMATTWPVAVSFLHLTHQPLAFPAMRARSESPGSLGTLTFPVEVPLTCTSTSSVQSIPVPHSHHITQPVEVGSGFQEQGGLKNTKGTEWATTNLHHPLLKLKEKNCYIGQPGLFCPGDRSSIPVGILPGCVHICCTPLSPPHPTLQIPGPHISDSMHTVPPCFPSAPELSKDQELGSEM